MNPKKLTLRNFHGIRSGLGRDELVLDVDKLAGDAELVAITGDNGMGKTTTLDNLQPFRLMASRATGYTPGSFSFYDQVYGAEAFKELIWEHAGATYRSTLVFKMPGKTRKTECYLHVQSGDDWTPYTAPDGTISDGKTDTYDRCVEAILGSPEMFFTSAFAAQNRKTLSNYGNGEIKGLMSELLGLDRVLALGKKAGDVAKGLRTHYAAMGDSIERLAAAESQRDTATADLTRDRAGLTDAQKARQQARDSVQKATRELADLQASQNANAEVEARRAELQSRLQTTQASANQAAAEIRADIQAADKTAYDDCQALHSDIVQIDMRTESLQKSIENQQALLDRKPEIDAAAERKKTLEAEEPARVETLEKARQAAEQVQEHRAEMGRLGERLTAKATAGKEAAAALAQLKDRIGLIGEVPCAGTELQSRCQLLSNAIEARDSIPAAQAKVDALRNEYQEMKQHFDQVKAIVDANGDPNQAVHEAETALNELRQLVSNTDKLLALRESFDHASASIADAQKEIRALADDKAVKEGRIKARQAEADKRKAELEARQALQKSAAENALQQIQTELDKLPTPADATVLDAAEKAVEDADAALSRAEQQIEALNAAIATAEANRQTAETEIQRLQHIKSIATRLETEIAHWSTLAKALSNDGIVALSIDDAGPTLASLTNDLLTSCYGPRFTVRIDTQREARNGNLSEAFDVVVFDAERDDEKSIRLVSGGEEVWLNEALTRAIALYQAQTSGRAYGCLLSDESDGALSHKRKQQFVAMKRKVLEIGGYKRELFISHTPELWSQADAVIDIAQFQIN
ncbi:MAG TPA: hypothetical protein VFM97_00500 [Gammaproteobacteria bacterium]|nr:hypothetical protein [Gammaproteobacteria bacterium]